MLRDKPIACEKWQELCEALEGKDQFDRQIDRGLLALYCVAWQALADAEELIEWEGEFFTTEKGYVGVHPAALKRDKAFDLILKTGQKLGIGVTARKGLKPTKSNDDTDPLDDF